MVKVEERYWDRIRDSKNPYNLRLKMVRFYLESRNYSLTAKAFKTSRQSVKKWVNMAGFEISYNVPGHIRSFPKGNPSGVLKARSHIHR